MTVPYKDQRQRSVGKTVVCSLLTRCTDVHAIPLPMEVVTTLACRVSCTRSLCTNLHVSCTSHPTRTCFEDHGGRPQETTPTTSEPDTSEHHGSMSKRSGSSATRCRTQSRPRCLVDVFLAREGIGFVTCPPHPHALSYSELSHGMLRLCDGP